MQSIHYVRSSFLLYSSQVISAVLHRALFGDVCDGEEQNENMNQLGKS